MLPLFRLIPVGGVLLAIAILLLALDPPPATNPSARVALALAPARGPLIDRNEHPEWRQFLILAALRRADEVERLRDLRDTVIRPEPLTQMPTPPTAAPQAAAPVEAGPEVVEPEPVAAEPRPAAEKPKVAEAASIAAAPQAAEAAVVVKPDRGPAAPTQVASITPAMLPDARPIAAATPSEGKAAEAAAATASTPETNGIRSEPAPTAAANPPAAANAPTANTKMAALPAAPVPVDDSDITGSIAPDHTATIPVGIGEASSIELLVTLPRVRPPALRRLDIRRARGNRIERQERRLHHLARAKTKKPAPDELPPELNLFALLFKAFDPDGNFQQIKPHIPYQPDKNQPTQ